MLSPRGVPLIYIVSILSAFSFLTVALRCYVRLHLLRVYWVDDFLMSFTFLLYVIFSALCILVVHYGVGKHNDELSDFEIQHAMITWWAAYILYGVIITLVKISVGLSLLRVAVDKRQRLLLWHAIHVTTIAAIVFLFVVILQCKPISFFWTRFLRENRPDQKCMNPKAYLALGYLFSVVCIVTDSIFGLLPIFIVRATNLRLSEKIALIPVLSVGAVACFAPIVRMTHLQSLNSPEYLYDTTDVAIWSAVEPGLVIIASSLATLRPLWHHVPFCKEHTSGEVSVSTENLTTLQNLPSGDPCITALPQRRNQRPGEGEIVAKFHVSDIYSP